MGAGLSTVVDGIHAANKIDTIIQQINNAGTNFLITFFSFTSGNSQFFYRLVFVTVTNRRLYDNHDINIGYLHLKPKVFYVAAS